MSSKEFVANLGPKKKHKGEKCDVYCYVCLCVNKLPLYSNSTQHKNILYTVIPIMLKYKILKNYSHSNCVCRRFQEYCSL